MRAMPGRHDAPGRAPAPPCLRPDHREPGRRGRSVQGSRAGDARRIHLRPRSDRRRSGRVRNKTWSIQEQWAEQWEEAFVTSAFVGMPKRMLTVSVDGEDVTALEGSTILDACRT